MFFGQNKDVRHAKSFVNKLEMGDKTPIDNQKKGNFFQFKSNERLEDMNMLNSRLKLDESLQRTLL